MIEKEIELLEMLLKEIFESENEPTWDLIDPLIRDIQKRKRRELQNKIWQIKE